MDRYERMQIRAYADWRERLKATDGKLIVDPTTGQIIADPEVHHIAGVKYGELSIPLSKATHAEMTRRS